MILSSKKKSKSLQFDRVIAISLGFLLLILLAVLTGIPGQQSSSVPKEGIYCGAEKVKKGKFVDGQHRFSRGKLQSRDAARSGRFSCKVEKGEGLQYGFGYELKDLIPGTYYQASVWQYSNSEDKGKLVVEGKGQDPFYLQSNQVVEKNEQGWEKLQLSFHVPFKKSLNHISIYTYTSGADVIYFDDLLIEKKEAWAASSFEPEVLQLKIEEKDLKKLEKNRAKALSTGILETAELNWVNAQIEAESDIVIPVKLRLKGDWLDHLRGDKWSFRIKVKDPNTWNQLTTFSLHTPSARHFLHEWLLHQFWEKEEVLTTRYDFVELRLNGQSLGIYAYEEHFEKQLVESRQRREGPILKLAEDGFWAGIKRQLQSQGYVKPGAMHSAMNKQNAKIEAFNQTKVDASPTLSAQFAEAQTLLHQFRYGLKQPGEVFDLELLAKYYAICDVLNAYHGITWHNQRFYYNPISNKLEPIGFDGFGDKPTAQYDFLGAGALNPSNAAANSIFNFLFLDQDFVEAYIKHVYTFSSRTYLDQFFESLAEATTARLSFLQMEFPEYQVSQQELITQAQYIHSLLLPFNEQSIKSFREKGKPQIVWLHNSHTLPVEVVGYGGNRKVPTVMLDTVLQLPGQTPRQVWNFLKKDSLVKNFNNIRFWEEVALQKQVVPLEKSLEVGLDARFIFYQLPGVDSLFYASISANPKPAIQTGGQQVFDIAPLTDNNWYRVEGSRILFNTGQHQIDQDIVIPPGYEVIIGAGSEFDFIKNAAFLSKSPVQMIGSEEAPIKFTSSDNSGQGITLLEAAQRSALKHVVIEKQGNLNRAGWSLTGAVNFYKSDVDIYRCVFRTNHCEDALNIIRSNFIIDQSHFNHTAYDAFDSDFSSGKVSNSLFTQIGNDGLDFSGSIVTISDCQIQDPGDKGISVGEESDVSVFNTTIQGAMLAMASKDLSMLYAKEVFLKDCDQGFAAYQKKPEFGGGKIVVESYRAENLRRLHAISGGSTLQLEDQLIEGIPVLQ